MLSNLEGVEEVPSFSEGAKAVLENTLSSFGVADALMVKKIERTTNHDVKAIEYVLKDKFRSDPELSKVCLISNKFLTEHACVTFLYLLSKYIHCVVVDFIVVSLYFISHHLLRGALLCLSILFFKR